MEIFKKYQAEAKLPPTKAALMYHIYHAHYQAMVWCNDHSVNPQLPSPELYGWRLKDEMFITVITDLQPAPKTVIELARCGCCLRKCRGRLCSCRKVDLVCTELCSSDAEEDKCSNTEQAAENIDSGNQQSDEGDDSSDEDKTLK